MPWPPMPGTARLENDIPSCNSVVGTNGRRTVTVPCNATAYAMLAANETTRASANQLQFALRRVSTTSVGSPTSSSNAPTATSAPMANAAPVAVMRRTCTSSGGSMPMADAARVRRWSRRAPKARRCSPASLRVDDESAAGWRNGSAGATAGRPSTVTAASTARSSPASAAVDASSSCHVGALARRVAGHLGLVEPDDPRPAVARRSRGRHRGRRGRCDSARARRRRSRARRGARRSRRRHRARRAPPPRSGAARATRRGDLRSPRPRPWARGPRPARRPGAGTPRARPAAPA